MFCCLSFVKTLITEKQSTDCWRGIELYWKDKVGVFSIKLALAFLCACLCGVQLNMAGDIMVSLSVAFCIFVSLPVLQDSAARAQQIIA